MAIGEDESVELGLDVDSLDTGPVLEASHIDFVIEVTDVTDDSVVLHLVHVGGHDDVLVTGGGDEDISLGKDGFELNDFISFHASLEGADRVNFSDVDSTTSSLQSSSATFADITVTADDSLLTSDHDVSSSHETIGKRVSATEDVVELALGDGIVDVDGGEDEFSLFSQFVESGNTSGGFFRNTDDVLSDSSESLGVFRDDLSEEGEEGFFVFRSGLGGVGEGAILFVSFFPLDTLEDEDSSITTIIDNSSGAVTVREGQGLEGAPPVFFEGFTLPGEDGAGALLGDGSSSLILSGVDVARAPSDFSTEGFEGFDEDGSLDGHVERTSDSASLKGLVGAEFFSAGHQTGHFDFSEVEFLSTPISKSDISNFVFHFEDK